MKQPSTGSTARIAARRLTLFTQAAVLALATLLPMILVNQASAAQLTDRQVTISDSVISETGVEYDFSFDFVSTDVEGIIFEFCDAPLPLSSCTKPAGLDVSVSNVAIDSQSGFPNNATAFAEVAADTNDCDDVSADDNTETMYCLNRTEATAAAGDDATIDLSGITNPSAIDTIYIRIYLYDDSSFTSQVHQGTVAAAIVEQLTVNGRVQERLDFCVAAIGDADALPANVSTCSGIADQNVDIGIVDESSVAVAPVDTTATNGSDDDYGALMLNTNASLGATLSYYAEDPSSVLAGDTHQLKSFRVIPADCDASAATLTDQCFQSAANAGSGSVITSGSELFGVYIPCIDTTQQATPGSSANLTADADYDGNDDTTTSAADCENEAFVSGTAVVGWNSGTTADTLATSTTTVEDEIVKLRFAATAEATTPSGEYTVTTTYIATANF